MRLLRLDVTTCMSLVLKFGLEECMFGVDMMWLSSCKVFFECLVVAD